MSNGTETERITVILDSCRNDAKDQLAALQELIANGDTRDIQAMATMVLAAENTIKTVEKYCRLSFCQLGTEFNSVPQDNKNGGGHGLARAAA